MPIMEQELKELGWTWDDLNHMSGLDIEADIKRLRMNKMNLDMWSYVDNLMYYNKYDKQRFGAYASGFDQLMQILERF